MPLVIYKKKQPCRDLNQESPDLQSDALSIGPRGPVRKANCYLRVFYPYNDSSVGRALHRYRRGHGFESRSGLNFIQALTSQLRVCNSDDQ